MCVWGGAGGEQKKMIALAHQEPTTSKLEIIIHLTFIKHLFNVIHCTSCSIKWFQLPTAHNLEKTKKIGGYDLEQ